MNAPLRLAFLGMIPGNGHPYSWAAIINGQYDREAMAQCPYPVIPQYLAAQPYDEIGLPGARVTHLWTENHDEGRHVAQAARIDHCVATPEAVLGHVDAVLITTDDGADHVRRARPFVEAGLPVFVDKPLATTRDELAQFIRWHRGGARLLSSSGLRYAKEIAPYRGRPWAWATATTTKTWERYGIHALEPLYTLLGPGFEEVVTTADATSTVVTARHQSGAKATVTLLPHHPASAGAIHLYGADGETSLRFADTYHAFRAQMAAVIDWVRTGIDPYPFEETIELMTLLIAAIESRETGRPVSLAALRATFPDLL